MKVYEDNGLVYIVGINQYEKDFGRRVNDIHSSKNCKEMLFVFGSDDVDFNLLARMRKVLKESDHHAFVVYDDRQLLIDHELKKHLCGNVVLVSTKYPFLISSIELDETDAMKALDNWAQMSCRCGYQIVSIGNTSENYKKKVLIYAPVLDPMYNGSSIHMIGDMEGLSHSLDDRYELYIYANKSAIEFHGLNARFNNDVKVLDHFNESDIFDVAFIPAQFSSINYFEVLVKHAKKWILWPLDCISYRSSDLFSESLVSGFNRLLSYVDGIIFTSQNAQNDFRNYYYYNDNLKIIPQKVIGIPAKQKEDSDSDSGLRKLCPFDQFVLVIGNKYPHKMIKNVMPYIMKSTMANFVVVGTEEEGKKSNNVYGYRSGGLDEKYMRFLHENAEMIIFPSVYEGFGLPLLDALNYGKEVIAIDSPLNHELEQLNKSFSGHVHYINDFKEIDAAIETARNNPPLKECNLYRRSWDDVGKEIHEFIDVVLDGTYDDSVVAKREMRLKEFKSSQSFVLNERYNALIAILETKFDKVDGNEIIDIYGYGTNGKLLVEKLYGKAHINTIIDQKKNLVSDNEIRINAYEEYIYDGEALVVVVPTYAFDEIRNKLILEKKVSENKIISVVDFCKTR